MLDHFLDNFQFRFIKVLDIGYITSLYFIMGVLFSHLLDYLFGQYDKRIEKQKHILYIGIELITMIWIIGISAYFVRNLVELIPSPFDGIHGLIHKNIKELTGAGTFMVILMGYLYHFKNKLDNFNKIIDKNLEIYKHRSI